MRSRAWFAHLLMYHTLGGAAGVMPSLAVEQLRCEYLVNPLGIDVPLPRLSWVLRSERRGEEQSAYQILVATSRSLLDQDRGDLWDSGKVVSRQSSQIAYGGERLKSRQRCFWKVRAWDRDDVPSAYSEPAIWEMGLLSSEDWHGQWIGTGRPILPVCSLEGASVLQVIAPVENRNAEGEARQDSHPSAERVLVFTKEIEVGEDHVALAANLRFSSRQPLSVYWDDELIGTTSGQWEDLQVFDVLPRAVPGSHRVAAVVQEEVTTATVAGHLELIFTVNDAIRVRTDNTWKSGTAHLDAEGRIRWADAKLASAEVVGRYGDAAWPRTEAPDARVNSAPAPLLRRTFEIDGAIAEARVSICGLGYYELSMNGERIGDARLDPGYTAYHKRVLYSTYDVTDALQPGKNTVGIMLGTGWYDVHTLAEWNFDAAPWRKSPRAILSMDVTLQDGRKFQLGTDNEWKWTDGPVRFDSIYEGETYDARLEIPGWDTAEYRDDTWNSVQVVTPPGGKLCAQMLPPIREMAIIEPVSAVQTSSGTTVFDLGQNIAGVPQLRIRGERGTSVTLRCGERLLPDGTVDQKEIAGFTKVRDPRQRFQEDIYILRGGDSELWEPRFTYHGFQYVEVIGTTETLTADNLRGKVWHTDMARTARFHCSNELLNAIWDRTMWSYVGNAHSIPTDCPSREKNGWTGDAHLAAELGLYAFDSASFYTKWLNDLADAQLENGDLPGIVPSGGWGYNWGIGPAWDSAYILIPRYMHQYLGDRTAFESHYAAMGRYVDHLGTRASNYIVSYGLGDWLPYDTETSATLTSTAYYYRDAAILAEMAEELGNDEDRKRWRALADKIKDAFNQRFFDESTGRYDNGSQTAQSCALYQGLVEPRHRERVLQQLLVAIEKADYHIDTGILGSKYLLNVLLDAGRADVAYRIASQRTLPSWGWWIEQGATTLWEQWRGQDSRNHIMFGEVSAWFLKALAGIRVAKPGFAQFVIAPQVVGDLTSAMGEYDSIGGRILSDWKVEGEKIRLNIEVPVNTRATVHIPTRNATSILEKGRPVSEVEEIRMSPAEPSGKVLEVGSGRYEFEADAPEREAPSS